MWSAVKRRTRDGGGRLDKDEYLAVSWRTHVARNNNRTLGRQQEPSRARSRLHRANLVL